MNCSSVRRWLLLAEDIEQPPTSVEEHLRACDGCRAWQRRLQRLESAIRQVPLPRTRTRVEFLCRFLQPEQSESADRRIGTPTERLEALTELARSLHGETSTIAHEADAGELVKIAELYEQVVRRGIVETARELSIQERRQTIDPIVDMLARTHSDMDCLAQTLPTDASAPLQQMGKAAQESDEELRALIRECSPPSEVQ